MLIMKVVVMFNYPVGDSWHGQLGQLLDQNESIALSPNHRIIDDRIEKSINGRWIGHNLR